MIGVAVIGLGNVFEGPYRTELAPLVRDGRVHVAAVCDPDPAKRRAKPRIEVTHAPAVAAWRRAESERITLARRPDLWAARANP